MAPAVRFPAAASASFGAADASTNVGFVAAYEVRFPVMLLHPSGRRKSPPASDSWRHPRPASPRRLHYSRCRGRLDRLRARNGSRGPLPLSADSSSFDAAHASTGFGFASASAGLLPRCGFRILRLRGRFDLSRIRGGLRSLLPR